MRQVEHGDSTPTVSAASRIRSTRSPRSSATCSARVGLDAKAIGARGGDGASVAPTARRPRDATASQSHRGGAPVTSSGTCTPSRRRGQRSRQKRLASSSNAAKPIHEWTRIGRSRTWTISGSQSGRSFAVKSADRLRSRASAPSPNGFGREGDESAARRSPRRA